METIEGGIEEDPDIALALEWFAAVSGEPKTFWGRLETAQQSYRKYTSLPENLGQDPDISVFGGDVVAAFFAQSKSLLDDRRSYDFALASRILAWIKQIGNNIEALSRVNGVRERAIRMLQASTLSPESAVFELVIASNYAADGFDVAFVPEERGGAKTPDMRLSVPGIPEAIAVECKRLQLSQYETNERAKHKRLFRQAAALIDERELSVHIDVTYTRGLEEVPETYLAERLARAISSPIITFGSYPWRDEYGFGEVKSADLAAVRQDIRETSLYFGTKLARLLSGGVVREQCYHLAAGIKSDDRDPRYIEAISYGSVVTWQCIAPSAIEKKARHVTKKLAEADAQLIGYGAGIAHLATDAELQGQSSDLRRDRNITAIKEFLPQSDLMAIYLHYLGRC